MYQPMPPAAANGGFWVPLFSVNWTWSADAILAGGAWQFKAGGTTAPGTKPTVTMRWNATNESGQSQYPTWAQPINYQAPCN